MSKDYNPVLRLSELALERDSAGSAYESSQALVARPLDLTRLGARYLEVPPGKSACPFHVHHAQDEMFVILSGEGEYRFGGARHEIASGDVLGAPVGGPENAHQLFNTGSGPLKYLAISSKAEIDVCEYPDSGKFALSSKRGDLTGPKSYHHIGRREQSLDYFDGDEGGQ